MAVPCCAVPCLPLGGGGGGASKGLCHGGRSALGKKALVVCCCGAQPWRRKEKGERTAGPGISFPF